MAMYRSNDRGHTSMWRRDQTLRSNPNERSADFHPDARQRSRMQWRAAGAQFYPGGAFDDLMEISQRGRGPKNYRRSDDLLQEIICEQLTESPVIDARDVSIEVHDCEVTLRGTVETREQKYAIEDLVADVAGVTEIHNYIGVSSSDIEARTSGLRSLLCAIKLPVIATFPFHSPTIRPMPPVAPFGSKDS